MKKRIGDVELAYDDHGMGLPIIFLHAFPLHRGMWREMTTALLAEQRYRLVALDLRGFGESEVYGDILTMDTFADDLAGLMDALGMRQAILVGLSMGGYVSFAFLRKYPERVRGLVLADTRPGADLEAGKLAREEMAQLALSEGVEAVADLQLPKLLSEETLQHRPEIVLEVRRMLLAARPQSIAAASRGMALRADSTDLLSTIVCPTLVIVGEQDALTPPEVARAYAGQIPGAQYAILPRAGHISNLEQPEAFLAALQTFLLNS